MIILTYKFFLQFFNVFSHFQNFVVMVVLSSCACNFKPNEKVFYMTFDGSEKITLQKLLFLICTGKRPDTSKMKRQIEYVLYKLWYLFFFTSYLRAKYKTVGQNVSKKCNLGQSHYFLRNRKTNLKFNMFDKVQPPRNTLSDENPTFMF